MRARTLVALGIALGGFGLAGCVIEDGSNPPPPAVQPQPAPTSTTPASNPPLIAIDKGPNLTSDPGAGAGVFVSYGGSGSWSIAWTCDTNTSGLPCQFSIDVKSQGIQAVQPTAPSDVVSQSPTELQLGATTTTTLERVNFATDVGASIVLSVQIDGRPQPNLVFYVSNGRIVSAPTDPIELVPVTP